MTEVPKFHEFFLPSLTLLGDGHPRPIREVIRTVADRMSLSPEQLAQTIPSGQPRVDNRVMWSLSYLSQAKAVERPQRGVYQITGRGHELLRSHPDGITVDHLMAFPEFVSFRSKSSSPDAAVSTASVQDETPLEQVAGAVERLDATVAAELIQRLHDQPPEFLEKAVLRLLVAMGYGGATGDAQHLGGSGDGGFDGVINQDTLGLERVYVQAKRYAQDNVVGAPAVQAFVGALHGVGAAGGVFITTSHFSPQAVDYARGIKPRVILIDGERLGHLMVTHQVGVQQQHTFAVVEIDEDFFE